MPRRKSQTGVLRLPEIHHSPEPLMAIFQAFFDESGKFKDKRVISFCGLCSPPARVSDFEEEWKGLLRHFALPSLTMKVALRRKRKFSPTVEAKSREERNAVLEKFALCIRKHFELGVVVAVDVEAYKKWLPNVMKLWPSAHNPHYFAFIDAFIAVAHYVREEDRLNLICDEDKETATKCYDLYSKGKFAVPDIRKKLSAITFADDEEFVPLQAADLLSSLCRLEAERAFHKSYYEYADAFKTLSAQNTDSDIKWLVHSYDDAGLAELTRSAPRHGGSSLART